MKSVGFPKMFGTTTSSNILVDKEATLNNIKILLGSEQGSLTVDPYFGIKLKRYLFDQNNSVLKDIIIDEIYSQLRTFSPQVFINRKDIDIIQDKGNLVATIKITNKMDFSQENYSLVIFKNDEV